MAQYSPFDFLNDINKGKVHLLREDELAHKDYSPFMVNRGLSYFVDTCMWANEINKIPGISKEMQYDFLFHAIPAKHRRSGKWAKPEKSDIVLLVMEYYGYNRVRANEVVGLLSDSDIEYIKKKLNRGGVK